MRRRPHHLPGLAALAIALTLAAPGASGAPTPRARYPLVTGWNFDWDDNIFNMPTQIRVTDKRTGREVGVSTAEFALIREQIGKAGKWKNFELRDNALRYFADAPTGINYFKRDVVRAIKASPKGWQGPSWQAFVKAMRHEETAKRTTLITARLHSPEKIYEGLLWLQREGYIKHVPPRENIFPVSSPALARKFGGSGSNPSAAKATVMMQLLDKLQRTPMRGNATKVLDPAGKGFKRMHLWGFSDDDYGNFSKAVSALSAEVKKGRWGDVKITVFFTGKNHPTEKPRAVVLTPRGGTRSATLLDRGAIPHRARQIGALASPRFSTPGPAAGPGRPAR